jgi:hypothetical protein
MLPLMYRVRMERGVCVQTPVASVLTRPTSAVKPVNVTSKVGISWPRAKCGNMNFLFRLLTPRRIIP